MKKIIIRQATLEDLNAIQNLNYELFKLEKENFDSTLIVEWPLSEEGRKYFEDLINNEYVIVAVLDKNIIGYLAGTINEKVSYEIVQYGEINNMLVDYEYRGLGIGKQLIDKFKEYCKNRNINNLKVLASTKNINAIEFYKKQGFGEFNITLTSNICSNKNSKTNIFVLHSLNGDTLEMWGKDIKEYYEKLGVKVTMPKFPIREESKYERFKEILKDYMNKKLLNDNSIIIAHSIGNAYFIRFCKECNYIPKTYIAVAPGACYEYPSSRDDYIAKVKKQAYLKEDALNYAKNMNCIKYCLYSDENDNNLEKFTRFLNDTNSEGIYLKYYNHFDGYHRIYKIPELNDLINKLL